MIKISNVEINLVFPQLGEVSGVDKLIHLIEHLGVHIMTMAEKVAELEASLAATAASIEAGKVAAATEAAEVKTRIDELIAQIGGVTPGDVITSATLDNILVAARALQTSAASLTKNVEDIFTPSGPLSPPTPSTLATDYYGNMIALNGDIVAPDGTIRYAVGNFTTSPEGNHFDMVGNLILPTSIP